MASTTVSAASSPILGQLLEALRGASEEQLADILSALHRDQKVAVVAKKVGASAPAGRPKKEPLPPPPMPEDGEEAPDAADYRLDPSEIKEDVCDGRIMVSPDKRWSVAIFSEAQCGAEITEDGLCKTCFARFQRYSAEPKPGRWDGRVSEDPLSWQHMLGTAWATQALESGKLKWLGGSPAPSGGAGTDSASVVSGSDSTTSGKMSVAEAKAAAAAKKAAEKETAKKAKEDKKEADRIAKEAEKTAKKAVKDAEKAAAKAAKASAAATEKAAKPTKAKAAASTASTSAAAAVPAKADTSAEVVETEGEMKAIQGDLYMLKGRKVYSYDMFSNAAGGFVGLLGADGETIDRDATEEDAEAESDEE